MTTDELMARLGETQSQLISAGFAAEHPFAADTVARWTGHSVWPIQLLLEWVRRTPEVADALAAVFAVTHSAQNSEPSAGPVRGTSADSIKVTADNVSEVLKGRMFATRPVDSGDLAGSLGDIEIRGLDPVKDEFGATLVARAKFHFGEVTVNFLDKRGPVIMMRVNDSHGYSGKVLNGCIEQVDPLQRGNVLAALKSRPGSDDEFSFSPFSGMDDPWKSGSVVE